MKLTYQKSQIFTLALIIISIIYASIMTSFDMEYFRDRANYIIYARDSIDILNRYANISVIVAIFNEPLFLLLNYVVSLFLSPESVVSFFIFVVTFSICYIVLKESRKNLGVLIIVFLLLPFCSYTFHLQLVTIRQGLATVLLLYAVHKSDNPRIWAFACLIASFIHISFLIIFAALILHIVFCGNKNSIFRILFIQFLFALIMSVALFIVARYLGIRQVDVYEGGNNSRTSGAFFIIWGFVLIYMLYTNKFKINNKYEILSCIFLTIFLVSYFTNPTAGRLMGTFTPFIFIALAKKKTTLSIPILLMLLFLFLSIFGETISKSSLLEPFSLKDYIFR
ncbi:EpsG family protein [Porphyromonadaceae bacterium NLAE-zl-C104]|nr:EpsG family protein [Porphyromonadaceae bacterium NLAE-zl-C104]